MRLSIHVPESARAIDMPCCVTWKSAMSWCVFCICALQEHRIDTHLKRIGRNQDRFDSKITSGCLPHAMIIELSYSKPKAWILKGGFRPHIKERKELKAMKPTSMRYNGDTNIDHNVPAIYNQTRLSSGPKRRRTSICTVDSRPIYKSAAQP